MTGAEIRQSFLDYFRSQKHTIVPSSSLMPDAPNLLFTNAGMNQFVPIFLGQRTPDVNSWPGALPGAPTRAADTQKCIRAGGKHNDLEDVGLDTYHQTLFEMLGNWSFGDYFKKEAIAWAWELVVERWGFPADRMFATVYQPGPGDPAEFDQEAWDLWAAHFKKARLDPRVHIVSGNKKDNFWMMGETGPCGPCSELHVDLTPDGQTQGALVNAGDSRCIEIWNLVFIQFNALPDGRFVPLPARHVDTGMGFERVCSIIQGTRNFADFKNAKISNYETDLFAPLLQEIGRISGKSYGSTLPPAGRSGDTPEERDDIAFRVIADHIRCLACAIADGILPSNEGRGYVLRRILRRAVRYGRNLGIAEPFLKLLVPTLVRDFGPVFPELRERQATVERVLQGEEESFGRTLGRGIELFNQAADRLGQTSVFPGKVAFQLYDTYGFPKDLTELMARERGLAVDGAEFDALMAAQKEQSQLARTTTVIEVSEEGWSEAAPTTFIGFETHQCETRLLGLNGTQLVAESTPFYAEMGGQLGDTGMLEAGGRRLAIVDTKKTARGVIVHQLEEAADLPERISLRVDRERRALIEGHHSGTHLLHWALRRVLGDTARQKGSYVGPDRLRFDFSHVEAMKADEIAECERLVNEHVDADASVQWSERLYAEVKDDPTVLQFFGEKYGERVRVVDIGGFSKELCGGTHVRNTAAIGFFKIVSEGAIAAGIRRLEAVAGAALPPFVAGELAKQEERHALLSRKRTGLGALLPYSQPSSARAAWNEFAARQAQLERLASEVAEWEKQQQKSARAAVEQRAAEIARGLAETHAGKPLLVAAVDGADAKVLQAVADQLKGRFPGLVLGGNAEGRAALLAQLGPEHAKRIGAGKLIQTIAPLVGGKGGGRPDSAQGGGPDAGNLDAALSKAREILAA